eukprot:5315551-Amphidinium_carterae.1
MVSKTHSSFSSVDCKRSILRRENHKSLSWRADAASARNVTPVISSISEALARISHDVSVPTMDRAKLTKRHSKYHVSGYLFQGHNSCATASVHNGCSVANGTCRLLTETRGTWLGKR